MRTSRLLCGLLLLPVLFVLAGCNNAGSGSEGGGGKAVTGNTIPIGAYSSLTGSEATFGQQSKEGEELAVEQANAAGGINGKKIELLVENDESDASKANSAVNKLISEDHVVTVIGEVASSRSLAAAPFCQSNKVPMVSPSSTNIDVTKKGDYIFRVCFTDPFQAYVIAKFARGAPLNAQNAAIFTENSSAYSKGFGEEFKKNFTEMGGKVVSEVSYNTADTDFKGQLTQIKAANASVIFVPGYYKSAGAIAKQAKELGMNVTMLGGDGWDSPDLFVTAGDTLEGAYFSDHMDIDSQEPVVKNFVDAYRKKYGESNKPGSLTALAYDATNIVIDAMKRAKSISGPDIRDALADTKDFKGVTGTITINKDRNADKPAVILQVQGHAFKYVTTIPHP